MSGNPQEGTAEDLDENQTPPGAMANLPENPQEGNQTQLSGNLDLSLLQSLDQPQNVLFRPMTGPLLPPK